jgi:hypothetical protein
VLRIIGKGKATRNDSVPSLSTTSFEDKRKLLTANDAQYKMSSDFFYRPHHLKGLHGAPCIQSKFRIFVGSPYREM